MNKDLDIRSEIEEIAPIMALIKEQAGQLPDASYFKHMQDKVLSRIITEHGQAIEMEGYFNGLTESVLPQVSHNKTTRVFPVYQKIIGIAASISIIVFGTYWMFKPTEKSKTIDRFEFVEQLSDKEMLYVLQQYATADQIAEVYNEAIPSKDYENMDVSQDELLQYIQSESDWLD